MNACGYFDKPCCLCRYSGRCIAGMREDLFSLASVEDVKKRLFNSYYEKSESDMDIMKRYINGVWE